MGLGLLSAGCVEEMEEGGWARAETSAFHCWRKVESSASGSSIGSPTGFMMSRRRERECSRRVSKKPSRQQEVT